MSLSSHLKRKHPLDEGTESSLNCSSSSSDTDGELSRLREENRKLRKLAKHYRRKYFNTKERLRDVSSLNIELQKRLFGLTPPYDTPPSSLTNPTYSLQQHYTAMMLQQHQPPFAHSPNDPCNSDPEVVEVGAYGFMGQEYMQSGENGKGEEFLSEEKFQEAVSYIQDGENGDSMFVKNLALAIWGKETLSRRSVTGRRCMAIMDSKPKPPLSPNKLTYIREKLIERVRTSEPDVSQAELQRRLSKINQYIANKINHLSRKPV
ncbi:hypothetical protein J437_LFUL010255 [Ladona fulva]|uniref:BEN domain-containing protein n=1 Tax=Ladona fulva TaxID=123851 RepID=A0A8K0KB10_LADFU|nr:hypothetical protein J437_LFUL010255 [Ladona fulva]